MTASAHQEDDRGPDPETGQGKKEKCRIIGENKMTIKETETEKEATALMIIMIIVKKETTETGIGTQEKTEIDIDDNDELCC